MLPRHFERVDWRPSARYPPDPQQWPFNVPAVAQLIAEGGMEIPPGVTFLVGENGSGKSLGNQASRQLRRPGAGEDLAGLSGGTAALPAPPAWLKPVFPAGSRGRLNYMEASVFFNPECTNCKTVKGILEERGIEADYVRYLDQAPSRSELERVMGLLGIDDPTEMMRRKEPVWDELNLDSADRDELIDAMVAHPILIQRPIVILGDRAIIARPAEEVLAIL